MTSKLSYEDVRRLARTWFAEAREKSNRDDADVEDWKKKQRKSNSYGGGFSGSSGGGGSDGGGGGCEGGD